MTEEEFRSQEPEFRIILCDWWMNRGLEQAILIVEIKKNFPCLKPLTSGMGYSDF
jgi:hypothetical protein